MEDFVTLELNASEKGWNCSGCRCFTPAFGRPLFGKKPLVQVSPIRDCTNWFMDPPAYHFCPGCGKPVRTCGDSCSL